VPIPLDASVGEQRRANKRAQVASAYTGPTFRSFLKEMRAMVSAEAENFTFADDVGVPAVMRLMQDTSQKEFKEACQRMIEVGGLDTDKVKSLFKWVEGIDGIGPELYRAVEAYLYPEDPSEDVDIDALAERHGVSADDVRSVSKVYQKLQDLA
jgi:hypothetical protein